MKIFRSTWNTYSTPYICIIPNKEYYQFSFVVLKYHWCIIINRKNK